MQRPTMSFEYFSGIKTRSTTISDMTQQAIIVYSVKSIYSHRHTVNPILVIQCQHSGHIRCEKAVEISKIRYFKECWPWKVKIDFLNEGTLQISCEWVLHIGHQPISHSTVERVSLFPHIATMLFNFVVLIGRRKPTIYHIPSSDDNDSTSGYGFFSWWGSARVDVTHTQRKNTSCLTTETYLLFILDQCGTSFFSLPFSLQ